MRLTKKTCILLMVVALAIALWPMGQAAAAKKPNILVIFGDDIGMYNISAYHRGMMGGEYA